MRVLLFTDRAYLPQLPAGGAEISTDEICRALQAHGCTVRLIAGLSARGAVGIWTRLSQKTRPNAHLWDRIMGYPVYRSWNPLGHLPKLLEEFRPQVALSASGVPVEMAKVILAHEIPVLVYLHDLDFGRAHELAADRLVRFVTYSQFGMNRIREQIGVEASVLAPIVRSEHYRVPPTGNQVTFINPLPHKGVHVALCLARRCKEIPFLWVDCRQGSQVERDRILSQCRTHRNISVRSRTRDMKSIYVRTRILLVPSQWEEAWGRVVTEAHISGIPVLASDVGGLPQAVGPGGRLVPRDAGCGKWVQFLREIWSDDDAWRTLSLAAIRYAQRSEINPTVLGARLVALLSELTISPKSYAVRP